MKLLEIGPLVIVDGLFTRNELQTMDGFMAGFDEWGLGYDMGDYGASTATLCKSVKWDMFKGKYKILNDIDTLMRERLPELGIEVPYFHRCLMNNFKVGDGPLFHKDSPRNDGSRTFMVYPNMAWELNWGGTTMFADDDDNVIAAANPKPGRIVIFPGHLNHCGVSPNKVHQGYGRYSMAFQSKGRGLAEDRNNCKPEDIKRVTLEEYYGETHYRLL